MGRTLHVGYTVQGVWNLLRRHGWSAQIPVRGQPSGTTSGSTCGRPRCGRAESHHGQPGHQPLLRGQGAAGPETAEGT
ncbi:winged helix-turn-helix domain-containing protein [Streptomyces mirabilis]|uniref:winged helix-turn-helix domain-containing protein n=1 Tax=Streptomyces mirabilis TaxID=68239 RepID=UPI00382E36E6